MAVTHMSCCLKYPCMYKADVKLSYSCLCQVNGVKQVDGKYHMLYFEEPKQDKKNFREIKIEFSLCLKTFFFLQYIIQAESQAMLYFFFPIFFFFEFGFIAYVIGVGFFNCGGKLKLNIFFDELVEIEY